MHRIPGRTALCVGFLAAITAPASAQVQRIRHGDTTIVRTTGNGVWGTPKMAVEEKRIGGGDTKEATFGRIEAMAALPSDGVVVYDAKSLDGPAIQIFDKDGRFIRNIGRIGSGPGEFRAMFPQPYVGRDGRTYLQDPGNARVNVYSSSGQYLWAISIPMAGFAGFNMIVPATQGGVFVQATSPWFPPGFTVNPKRPSYIRVDSTGHVRDSLPFIALEAGAISYESTVLSDGSVVISSRARALLLIRPPIGTRGLRAAELMLPRVAYLPAERAEREAASGRMTRGRSGAPMRMEPLKLPEYKQPFVGQIFEDNGRIWIQRSVTAVKTAPTDNGSGVTRTYRDPPTFDAFLPDGTFLGEVVFPLSVTGFRIFAFSGDAAWATVLDENGEQYVTRFRIPGVPKSRP